MTSTAANNTTKPPPIHQPSSAAISSATASALVATEASVSAAAGATNNNASDATTKLAEAIDDFLGDLGKKFKGISDEILTRLDDMAERCDRLEQEMMLRDASSMENLGKAAGSSSAATTGGRPE